jgi:hypothetical protein
MKATFDTEEFGKITCERDDSQMTGSGTAYFHRDDMEASINFLGDFKHPFSEMDFSVHWPIPVRRIATLQVWMPRTIGLTEID